MPVTEAELKKYKVPELKEKLKEFGIRQPQGLKADLIRQLVEVLNTRELQQQQQLHQQQQQQQHLQQVPISMMMPVHHNHPHPHPPHHHTQAEYVQHQQLPVQMLPSQVFVQQQQQHLQQQQPQQQPDPTRIFYQQQPTQPQLIPSSSSIQQQQQQVFIQQQQQQQTPQFQPQLQPEYQMIQNQLNIQQQHLQHQQQQQQQQLQNVAFIQQQCQQQNNIQQQQPQQQVSEYPNSSFPIVATIPVDNGSSSNSYEQQQQHQQQEAEEDDDDLSQESREEMMANEIDGSNTYSNQIIREQIQQQQQQQQQLEPEKQEQYSMIEENSNSILVQEDSTTTTITSQFVDESEPSMENSSIRTGTEEDEGDSSSQQMIEIINDNNNNSNSISGDNSSNQKIMEEIKNQQDFDSSTQAIMVENTSTQEEKHDSSVHQMAESNNFIIPKDDDINQQQSNENNNDIIPDNSAVEQNVTLTDESQSYQSIEKNAAQDIVINDNVEFEKESSSDVTEANTANISENKPVLISNDGDSGDNVQNKDNNLQVNQQQTEHENVVSIDESETVKADDHLIDKAKPKQNDESSNDKQSKLTEEQQQKQQEDDDDDQDVKEHQKFLLASNLTEEQWSKMSKNHRRKLKKKYRNKIKRIERDEIEKRRQELRQEQLELQKQQRELQQKELEIKQEIITNDDYDDDRMDIDEEDAPEEEKELKRLEELKKQQELAAKQKEEEEARKKKDEDTIEIEYVPEDMPKDSVYLQFLKVFDKFSAVSSDEARRLEQERLAAENQRRSKADDRAKLLELKKPVELELKDDDDKGAEHQKLSKRKLKQLTRMSVAELKQIVSHPELVEMHDVTAKDPVLLLLLKSTRNTVPVPRHWCYKRKYLQGKRGFEKPPFKLPEFIRRTGIQEMREAVLEKEDSKSLKTKMKEKIRPKMGKIDIDYQKLHDAFFKWQTKPRVTIHGDLYYEGKEFETRLKDKKPGELTNELRQALGMPTGPNAHKCPPPWLIAMQRYGPPPSYPSIKIPGLNAPIPEGCCFGYHAGGWGKPPVDEYGRPLYGDVFGLTSNNREQAQPEEEIDRSHWGEMESDEEEEEESEEEEDDDAAASNAANKGDKERSNIDATSGLVTPANNMEGLVTPSGISTGIPSGLETPDMIELRKRKQQIEAEMESDDQQQLYTVIPEKKVDRFAKDMMGSMHVYDFASLSKTTSSSKSSSSSSNGGVDVALDPSELESGQLDSTAVAAKYEQTLRESSSKNPHEDLSDMVAEYAAKQKRKKHSEQQQQQKHSDHSGSGGGGTSTSKSSKKYQFKF